MKIPFLSGLKVNGKVELNNLLLLTTPTKILTIDENNNITYSTSVGGSVDLSNYYNKSQTDSNISNAIANLVSSAPTTLDTLNELAAALGNDPNFATTVTNLIGTKANLIGGNDFSGNQKIDSGYLIINGLADPFVGNKYLSFKNDPTNPDSYSYTNIFPSSIGYDVELMLPDQSGTLALVSQIPDLTPYALANGSNASGTWGININGSSNYLQGVAPSETGIGNTIVKRSPDGYVQATYFNMLSPAVDATDFTEIVTTIGNGYLRRNSFSALKPKLGIDNGSTLNNNISGTAANSTLWNNKSLIDTQLDTGYSSIIGGIYVKIDDNPSMYPMSAAGIREYLNLPASGVYDLQWVLNNGAVGNRIILNKIVPSDAYNSNLELGGLEGSNPAISFHKPSEYIAKLEMNAGGMLSWLGSGFYANGFIQASAQVIGQRIVAGYDSGVAGSINTSDWLRVGGYGGVYWANREIGISVATDDDLLHLSRNSNNVGIWLDTNGGKQGGIYADNTSSIGFINSSGIWSLRVSLSGWAFANSFNASDWFRSLGNSGWYNQDYGGGIYMEDSTWVRTYNNKGFYVGGSTGILAETKIEAPNLKATSKLEIPEKNSSGVATGNVWEIYVEV